MLVVQHDARGGKERQECAKEDRQVHAPALDAHGETALAVTRWQHRVRGLSHFFRVREVLVVVAVASSGGHGDHDDLKKFMNKIR